MKLKTVFTLFVCLFLTVSIVDAQPGGRGGGGGGGGGGRGGGGFGGGAFGGGGRGGGGGDVRQRMMERLDRNGNGSLEESEVSTQMRGFVQRITGSDELKFPLSIASATGSSSNNRGRGGSREAAPQDEENKYPLVAGFGDDSILGFGVNPNLLNGRLVDIEKTYDDRVRSTLDRTMDRYDKNKNGVLEYEEWSAVSWQSDPRETDLDHDGNLTRAEMAERYMQRNSSAAASRGARTESGERTRGGNERGRGGDNGRTASAQSGRPAFGGFGGRGGGDQGGGRGGGRGEAQAGGRGGGGGGRGGFDPSQMLQRFDNDGDGKINLEDLDDRVRSFAERMLQSRGIDISKGVIDLKELQQSAQGGQAKKKVAQVGIVASTTTEGSKQFGQSSFRREKKKIKGMPKWFDDRDENKDNQISLSEYLTSKSPKMIEEFQGWDVNSDGIVTPEEVEIVEDDK